MSEITPKNLKQLFDLNVILLDRVKQTFIEDFKDLEKKISDSDTTTKEIKDNTVALKKELTDTLIETSNNLISQFQEKINTLNKDLTNAIVKAKDEADSTDKIERLKSDFRAKMADLQIAIDNIQLQKGDKGDDFTFDDFTPEQLELLKGDKGEIPKEEIQNIKDRLDLIDELEDKLKALNSEINVLKSRPTGRVGGGKKITSVRSISLTDQLDGATKSFTLPADTLKVLGVWGTQFPVTFNSVTAGGNEADFSLVGRTLVLGDQVGAPEAGQTLECLIESQFYA